MFNRICIPFRTTYIELIIILQRKWRLLASCPSVLAIRKENGSAPKWYSFSFLCLLFRLLPSWASWAVTHFPLLTSLNNDLVLYKWISHLCHKFCIHAHFLSLTRDAWDAAYLWRWHFRLLFCTAANGSIISLLCSGRSRLCLVQRFRYNSTTMLFYYLSFILFISIILCLTLLNLALWVTCCFFSHATLSFSLCG